MARETCECLSFPDKQYKFHARRGLTVSFKFTNQQQLIRNKMDIKQFLIALALTLMPTLASAQGSTYFTNADPGGDTSIHWLGITDDAASTINLVGVDITTPVSGALVIPSKVTDGTNTYTVVMIGTGFPVPNQVSANADITSVTFPPTLIRILPYSFFNCTGLTTLDFSPLTALETMEANAFSGCTGLTTLDFSSLTALATMGANAFNGCTGLTGNLDLSPLTALTAIGNNAFYNCPLLDGTLSLPNNGALTSIGDHAFESTHLSGSLTIPSTVTKIGMHAFGGCRFSGDITMPSSVTSIGEQAFTGMDNARSFTLSSQNLTMGKNVFWDIPHLEYIDMSNASFATMPTSLSRHEGDVFGGLATHTLVYLPHDGTGTLSSELSALGNLNNANYVLDGVCESLRIEDGASYFVPNAFTATTAQYIVSNNNDSSYVAITPRTFTKGRASTVYLPYPFKLVDPAQLRGYTLLDKKNDSAEVFRFAQQDPTVGFAANTPYVVRDLVGGNQLPVATNVTVPVTPISGIQYVYDFDFDSSQGITRIGDRISSTYSGGITAVQNPNCAATINDPDTSAPWGFYGTTETITNALALSQAWNAWIMNSNVWYSLGSQDIAPLRCFLYSTDPSATARPSIEFTDIDGGTTGIIGLDGNEPTNSVELHIYNINGQYLGNDLGALPKGVYIVNGEKVIKN